MERLYNPDLMPEEEIKATFVARQDLVDEIVALIRHQPKGAGVQHAVRPWRFPARGRSRGPG